MVPLIKPVGFPVFLHISEVKENKKAIKRSNSYRDSFTQQGILMKGIEIVLRGQNAATPISQSSLTAK